MKKRTILFLALGLAATLQAQNAAPEQAASPAPQTNQTAVTEQKSTSDSAAVAQVAPDSAKAAAYPGFSEGISGRGRRRYGSNIAVDAGAYRSRVGDCGRDCAYSGTSLCSGIVPSDSFEYRHYGRRFGTAVF